eukprot:COSAG02_NODE_135_length_34565_cov_80.368856_30_plen_1468_part_00
MSNSSAAPRWDIALADAARTKANAAMLAVLLPQCLAQPPGAVREALAESVLAHGGPDLRATAEGVPPASPGDATSSRSASRSLCLEPERPWSGSRTLQAAQLPAAGERELRSMKLTPLIARATAAGVSEKQLEDEVDHKGAVIKLILATNDEGEDGTATLRAELSTMTLTKLMKRASAAGVREEALEAAEAEADHKGAVIALILDQEVGGSDVVDDAGAALRAELHSMTLTKLIMRSTSVGVTEAELEDAEDEQDHKGAVIELIVLKEMGDCGPADAAVVVARADPAVVSEPELAGSVQAEAESPNTKHVMLSYNWDHQAQVKRVHDLLTELGIKCWMDIAGGMSVGDIYDAMAEGVSNAYAVVCFMSQKYQDSENCRLELKFAKQNGLPIVPVMMEGDGWRASGCLGLLTAGALWTDLTNESEFDKNVRQLHGQIQMIGSTLMNDEGTDVDEVMTSPSEAKEELDRLRDTLQPDAKASAAAVLADPSQPATIPAGVPRLPTRFQSTEQIAELTRLVLSTCTADMKISRVGFWGMGGIGKTVTGATIARDDGVRAHFDAIIWLPLGQTPVISKMQNLCHMQCTGRELATELSSEERQQALQQAMAGKRVLLCLDDLWEAEHETKLNFVDASAGSKVLISTRIKGLLEGGHQMEVGLPSPADSSRMLLSAAGAEESSQPKGVPEIVDLCGRLPLALGIAGRLAASYGLAGTDDWSQLIDELKEELRDSHSGGTEEGIIRASLRGLKSSAAEQANVKALLLLFAFVPEDTHCPLDVLLLMFKAVHKGSGVTMMKVRKWLKVLIDRSLVLGTVDRPSVHDLVRDWTEGQHTEDDLRGGHRRIVEAFRKERAKDEYKDAYGRCKYDTTRMNDDNTRVDDPLVSYVCAEVGHHFSKSMLNGEVPLEWLGDVPQDPMVVSCGRVLGAAKLTSLAEEAERDDDWWLAARYWTVLRTLTYENEGQTSAIEPLLRALAALGKVELSAEQSEHKDDIHIDLVVLVFVTLDISVFPPFIEDGVKLLQSKAASRDPVAAYMMRIIIGFVQVIHNKDDDLAREMKVWGNSTFEAAMTLKETAKTHPDPLVRLQGSIFCINLLELNDAHLLAKKSAFWSVLYGDDGIDLIAAAEKYDYDSMHRLLGARVNGDWFNLWTGSSSPLALHWGNIKAACNALDQSFGHIRTALEEPNQQVEIVNIAIGVPTWAQYAFTCELDPKCQQTIATTMVSAGLTWHTADATADRAASSVPWIRDRGKPERQRPGSAFTCAEFTAWLAKAGFILVSKLGVVSEQEVVSMMPSIDEVIRCSMNWTSACIYNNWQFSNLFVTIASAWQKIGRHDKALKYATAGLNPDLTEGGTTGPTSRVTLMLIQGRAHAALGRTSDAGMAFTSAANEAHTYGLHLYEMQALRDLKLSVLDNLGHGDHGARKLGAVLRLLKGSAEQLTPMLKGLDSSELMALPPPDANYSVVYAQDEVPLRA